METAEGPVSAEVVPPPSSSANHQADATVVVKPTTPNGIVNHSPASAVPSTADGGGGDSQPTPSPADVVTVKEKVMEGQEAAVVSSSETVVVHNQEQSVAMIESSEAKRTEPSEVVPEQSRIEPPVEETGAGPNEAIVRSEPVEPVIRPEPVLRTEPEAAGRTEPVVRTELAIVAVNSEVANAEPVNETVRTNNELVQQKPSEGSSEPAAPASQESVVPVPAPAAETVVVEESRNIVPQVKENEKVSPSAVVDRTSIGEAPSPSALVINESPSQVISTTQDSPLVEQGIDEAASNDDGITPAQIVNKPVSAMLASSGSSRKNRRKASRPMQINRITPDADADMESSSQESTAGDVNIESMIHAASDITDFCDIANRFIGGDDEDNSSDNLTPPTHSLSSTPSEQIPSDDINHQTVPVQEMAKVAIARQQNIPLSSSPGVSITKPQIIRQSSSLLPMRNRQPPSLRASPGAIQQQQQQPQRQASPRVIYKTQAVPQQIIRQVPQQQQMVQQQPQQFIMQQPVQQGKRQNEAKKKSLFVLDCNLKIGVGGWATFFFFTETVSSLLFVPSPMV